MPDIQEQAPLCELRFDIPLAAGYGDRARLFERAWRAELAAQKKTALVMSPAQTVAAQTVAARFRVVGPDTPGLRRHLQTRLAARPGGPVVTTDFEAATPQHGRPEWSGVQIWPAYPAADLPALLRAPKNAKTNAKPSVNTKPNTNRHTRS